MYNTLLISIIERVTPHLYGVAIVNWKKWLEDEVKRCNKLNILMPVYTTPGTWDDVKLFGKLRKQFSLTAVPNPDAILELKDGRTSIYYKAGDCVVLDCVEPQFAKIIAFTESNTSINPLVRYPHSKHFAIVRYLYGPNKRPDLKKLCHYCTKPDQYKPSRCLEEGNCSTCVTTEIQTKTYEVEMTDELAAALAKSGTDPDLKLTRTKKVKVTVKRKAEDHDDKMNEIHKKFPKLHMIPFDHYHANHYYDLQEVTNIVTKILMIEDVRGNVPSYFYVSDPLRNM